MEKCMIRHPCLECTNILSYTVHRPLQHVIFEINFYPHNITQKAKDLFYFSSPLHQNFAIITAIKIASSINQSFICLSSPHYQPPWQLSIQWLNCKSIIIKIKFHCSHIYRERNTVADTLINLGVAYVKVCMKTLGSSLSITFYDRFVNLFLQCLFFF